MTERSRAAQMVMNCIKEAGISQTELASRMGIDRRNLNEMLMRQKDLKAERWFEMLECAGYTLEIKKLPAHRINENMSKLIQETASIKGKFWCQGDGRYQGLISEESGVRTEMFASKEDCLAWLE